jgi:hypothetical protein
MRFRSFFTLWACLFFQGQGHLMAQLSGVVNTYVKVTAVDYACAKVTVTSTAGFSAGDKVLLIQMQGATIDQANSITFGNITAIGDAGNYEFALIDRFVNNEVYFQQTLLKTYTPSGSVQMIRVPRYGNISIDGELQASPWDGNTGGIIVLESSGTITLNADINASEQGFRGGDKSLSGGTCVIAGQNNFSFAYPTSDGGQKGEGINTYIPGAESGRGKNSTGGGGGNNHNTGGGGGGNYGIGGRGGDKNNTSVLCTSFAPNPFGLGAIGLSTTYYSNSTNKVFMGGGGGGGQQNNGFSYDAGNGGGIIMLKAASINTNGYLIKSNGGSVNSFYTSIGADNGDGNSGGGAGGTILLDVASYASAAAIEVVGGKGGNTGYLNFNFGPGGGGGGGVIWHATSATSGLLSANTVGGNAGISGSGGGNGSGASWNAANGGAGTVLSGLVTPSSTTPSSCSLPVSLLFFNAHRVGRYRVQLDWATALEKDNAYFTVEKSSDGIQFYTLNTIKGKEESNTRSDYHYIDETTDQSIVYYRLQQTDEDGTRVNLGVQVVYPESQEELMAEVYPNPFEDQLIVRWNSPEKIVFQHAYISNVIGEVFYVPIDEEEAGLRFDTRLLKEGVYSLMIQHDNRLDYFKVVKH